MDPQAVPRLKAIEIACWFDSDFAALDAYGQWRRTGLLDMTLSLCQQFRRAWCRYYVRFKPLDVKKPAWLQEQGKWTGISVEWSKTHGVRP